jgi:catechol 2,3-dioxygenase-like lactoylglutathione lyase family enzyme
MIQSLAFAAYPVSDIVRARRFYEDVLGLKLTHEAMGEWFEYDLGDTAFAITKADEEHPVPVRGAVVAFEVSDLDAATQRCVGVERRWDWPSLCFLPGSSSSLLRFSCRLEIWLPEAVLQCPVSAPAFGVDPGPWTFAILANGDGNRRAVLDGSGALRLELPGVAGSSFEQSHPD